MRDASLKCPKCSDGIIKSYENEVKLRAKVVKWTEDGFFAICKSCGNDVEIDDGVIKSIKTKFVYEVNKNPL